MNNCSEKSLFRSGFYCRIAITCFLLVLSRLSLGHIIEPAANCYDIDWAGWSNFTGNSSTGTINSAGDVININMTSNFTFDATSQIYNHAKFNNYPSPIPNSTVPRTTWSKGAGGSTTMCFSKKVTNPVLLIASLGASSGLAATLDFSLPYVVLFDGGGMTYNSSSSLTGVEGYAIVMFPGDFTCVTVNSTTEEFYTNITWGIRPPPFQIDITEASSTCGSLNLLASGGASYLWNGGDSPQTALNTFHQSATYIVTVTNSDGCVTSASKNITVTTGITGAISGSDVGCGSVSLTASGGVSYLWDGGTSPTTATNTFDESGTYTVVIGDLTGCTATVSKKVEVESGLPPDVSITSSKSGAVCAGLTTSFWAASTTAGANSTYQWFRNGIAVGGGTTYSASDFTSNEEVFCQLTDSRPCFQGAVASSNTVVVTIPELPAVAFSGDLIILDQNPVQTSPIVSGNISSYSWTPATGLDDPSAKNPLANPDVTTIYRLTVTSAEGCEAFADLKVTVAREVIVPNTFTPNGDGINDIWNIQNLSAFREAVVSVYNRFGERIFQQIGYNKPWDGTFNNKPVPVGTYYYVIDFRRVGKKIRKGYIEVLR